jgi:porin
MLVLALAASVLLSIAPVPGFAESTGAPQAAATPAASASASSAETVKPDLLDGSLSAKGELEADEAMAPPPRARQRLEENSGITFGASFGFLYQTYSSTTVFGEGFADGAKFTLNANVPLFNRGKPNEMTFDLAVEARGPIGTVFPPLQAGILAGSGVPTAATWGRFNLGITQGYVRQSLAGNRFQYAVGKLFAPNYVDAYPFFDDNRQFLNLAFSTSPTIASPLRGFGFVTAGFPGNGNLYLSGGAFTANSSDTGTTIGDFFSRNEHFYFIEGGETSFARRGVPINARGPLDSNNIHITLWYRDALASRGPGDFLRPSPEAYGGAFSANYMAGQNVMWFLRAGIGTGSSFGTGAAAGGIGWRPPNAQRDLFGAAIGWTNPMRPMLPVPLPQLRAQGTGELFYRIGVMPNIAITPDYQLLYHPTLSPSRNTLSVYSFRARFTI